MSSVIWEYTKICFGIKYDKNSEIYSQIEECDKIRINKSKNNKSKNLQTHPQAIYTSRLLNFKNLPEPVNSSVLSFNSGNLLNLLFYKNHI